MSAARTLSDADIAAIARAVAAELRAPRPRPPKDAPRARPSQAARERLARMSKRKGW